MDVGGFGEASWEGKSSQEASKIASKNDEKTKGNKMAKKSQQEVPTTRDPRGPGPWGGPPLLGGPALGAAGIPRQASKVL